MKRFKTGDIIIPFGVFLITLFIVMFNLFDLNELDKLNSFATKNLVVYVINIAFWLTTAYLINKTSMIFFWSNLIKQPGKNSFFKLLYRIFSMLMYTLALAEILFGVLPFVIPEVYWYIFLLLFFISGVVFHNKITEFFGTNQLSFEGSYNLGDWVELVNSKSGVKVVGKVLDFTRKEIILQRSDNSIAFIPNEQKENIIVINYDSLEDKQVFEIKITVSAFIPTERVKRILLACAKEYFVENMIKKYKESTVLISDLVDGGVVYTLKFYIKPYKDAVPGEVKDKILGNIIRQFGAVGVELSKGVFVYRKSNERGSIPTRSEELVEGLKNIDLFCSLTPDEFKILAENITLKTIHQNETLIKQGDEGNTMYLLIEGLLSVNVLAEQETVKVGFIKPGSFFGEMSLLTGEKRNATIITETESVVYEINRESIEKIILARKEILNNIAEVVAVRQKANLMKLEELKMHKDNLSGFMLNKIKDFLHIK